MATQYTTVLKLALPVTGELSGTWGDVVNDNITSMVEQAVAGLATINTWTTNTHTLTVANGTTSESRCAMLVAQDGAGLTAAGEIICPAATKLYVLKNSTTYAITLKTASGTGVAVPVGQTAFLFCDGTNVNACVTTIVDGNISGNLTVSGNTTLGDANTDTITTNARFNTDLLPSTDNARDLGSSANSWKDLYIDGTATMALIAVAGGTINNTTIGATTASTGAFTTLSSSSTTTLNGTTIPASKTLVDTDSAQTLTNKTLTNPAIASILNTGTLTLPTSTDTLVGRATTDTLTNKTISGANNTLSNIANASLTNSSITFGSTAQALGSTVSALNGVSIGATTASTGAFTNLAYTGTLTGGTGVINIGSGQLVKDASGRLGLGVTPSAWANYYKAFQVGEQGALANTSGITVLSTNWYEDSGGSGRYIGTGNATQYFQNAGTHVWRTAPSGTAGNAISFTEAMRIDSAGNVGIGTSSPASLLNVSGGTGITINSPSQAVTTGAQLVAISTSAVAADAGGQIAFGGLFSGTSSTLWGSISGRKETATSGDPSGYLVFATRPTGGATTERMRIDSAGKVLIGASSSDLASTSQAMVIGSGGLAVQFGGSTGTYLKVNPGDANTVVNLAADARSGAFPPLTFSTSATERMRITSAGNVGIGTSAPAEKLTVQGDLGVLDSSNNLFSITTSALGTTTFFTNNGGGTGGTYGQYIWLSRRGSNPTLERMRIDSSGNVGIGTSSPLSGGNLALRRTDYAQFNIESARTSGNIGGVAFFDGTNTGRGVINCTVAGVLSLRANSVSSGDQHLTIDSAGNVGIGTSSPVGLLSVYKNQDNDTIAYVENGNSGASSAARFDLRDGGSHYLSMRTYGQNATGTTIGVANAKLSVIWDNSLTAQSSGLAIGTAAATPLMFSTNATERMRIDSSGNLLVGQSSTTIPGAGNTTVGISFREGGLGIFSSRASGAAAHFNRNNDGANTEFFRSGNLVGSVNVTSTATTYATSSDYRLKHDIQPMIGALAKVAQLKPVTYKWNVDDSQSQGFIAHELQEVVPECVTGEKDAVDADGKPVYQGIDTSFLVATLTAALQEAVAEINALKARLDAANL